MEISGGNKLESFLKEAAKKATKASTMEVGFLPNATYDDGKSVAMIAVIQNFGAPSRGIPPRPFFTNMVAAKGDAWPDQLAGLINHFDGDTAKALQALGEGIAGQLADSIDETNSPPNSPVTNLLKQRFPIGGKTFADVMQARSDVASGIDAPAGKPLVQSGVMKNSIGVEVK